MPLMTAVRCQLESSVFLTPYSTCPQLKLYFNTTCRIYVAGLPEFQRLVDNQWLDCAGVYGYIQMAAPVFYELLPDDNSRLEWYTRFKDSNEVVMT